MSSNPKKKGMAVGVAIGAVVGVITGILFAPKSGKETRQDIKEAAAKAAERFTTEAKKLHEELNQLIEKGEEKIKSSTDEARKKVSELVDQAKHSRDSLKTLLVSVKAGEADDKDLDKAIKKANEAREALKKYLKK